MWKNFEDKKAVADMIRWNMHGNQTIYDYSHKCDDVERYLTQVGNTPYEDVVVSEKRNGNNSVYYTFSTKKKTDDVTEVLKKKDEEILQLKMEKDGYRRKLALSEKKNKELQQQHEEDEARMLAGFGSLVLETYENGEITNQQLVETDTHKALAESQKQNDLSKKQIKEMEQQIKVLNDKLGNTTVPLTSLSEGLKRYAKLYGLKEGKDLLKSLSYILRKEHVWVDNVENLENFFIKAEEENKTPALALKNESGGIVQISETKLP